MCDYEYDFSKPPNTTSPEYEKPPRCICLSCLQAPRNKVFLNGEQQGYVIFAAVGDPNGIVVQWKPMEDGKCRWSIQTGKVTLEIE